MKEITSIHKYDKNFTAHIYITLFFLYTNSSHAILQFFSLYEKDRVRNQCTRNVNQVEQFEVSSYSMYIARSIY